MKYTKRRDIDEECIISVYETPYIAPSVFISSINPCCCNWSSTIRLLLMGCIRMDLGVVFSLCVHGADSWAGPHASITLRLQRRAHRDGLRGVGCWVQRSWGGGWMTADCRVSGQGG